MKSCRIFIACTLLGLAWHVSDSYATSLPDTSSQTFSLYQQGLEAYEKGKLDQAYELLSNALSESPEREDVRYWLGMTLYRQDRLSKARDHFLKLTRRSGSTARGFDGLGLVYLKQKNQGFASMYIVLCKWQQHVDRNVSSKMRHFF